MRRESSHSRLRALRAGTSDPNLRAKKSLKKQGKSPWGGAGGMTDAETDLDVDETDAEGGGGGASESEWEGGAAHGPGESTLFLPGDAVFWLPYALSKSTLPLLIPHGMGRLILVWGFVALVSRYPVYDLMRDYLTLSWARFSKDVQSHTLQISKILAHPAPRAGELVRIDASPTTPRPGTASGSSPSLPPSPPHSSFPACANPRHLQETTNSKSSRASPAA